MVSITSFALFSIGGLVLKALHDALNLAEPLHLFFATVKVSEEEVGKWLADKAAEIIFHEGVERVLQDACVDPADFVNLLRDTVILEHPELVGKTDAADDDGTLSSVDISRSSSHESKIGIAEHASGATENESSPAQGTRTKTELKMSSRDAVFKYKQQQNESASASMATKPVSTVIQLGNDMASVNLSDEKVAPVMTRQQTLQCSSSVCVSVDKSQLENHPYHYAVFETTGDLEQFKEVEGWFGDGEADINDLMDVKVDTPNGESTMVPMPAHIYASYLGYLNIVQYLLGKEELNQPQEKKFVTLRRARQASSNSVAA